MSRQLDEEQKREALQFINDAIAEMNSPERSMMRTIGNIALSELRSRLQLALPEEMHPLLTMFEEGVVAMSSQSMSEELLSHIRSTISGS